MRNIRIYQNAALERGKPVQLDKEACQHLFSVLRLKTGNVITLFNGDGFDYSATLTFVEKRQAEAQINDKQSVNSESPLTIHLGQVISRGDKMDWVIQKSVELGVNEITPLFSERCGVKLDLKKQEKRLSHWQKVVISACEQCGRSVIPAVNPPLDIEAFFKNQPGGLILSPRLSQRIKSLTPANNHLTLAIGPEGGFTEAEIELARKAHYQTIRLGPRILRTETAALTAISCLQLAFGDF